VCSGVICLPGLPGVWLNGQKISIHYGASSNWMVWLRLVRLERAQIFHPLWRVVKIGWCFMTYLAQALHPIAVSIESDGVKKAC
jgi:hypothetical protein